MSFYMLVEEDKAQKKFFIGDSKLQTISNARHDIDLYPEFEDYSNEELIEHFESGNEEYSIFEVPLEYKDYTQKQLLSIYRHFFTGIIPQPKLEL